MTESSSFRHRLVAFLCLFAVTTTSATFMLGGAGSSGDSGSTYSIATDLCRNLNCSCVNTTARKTIHCAGHIHGELPADIVVPAGFTEIDFSRNSITAIRANTFNGDYVVSTLAKMDFSNNEIELVEDRSFEVFAGLRELVLRRNRIANLTMAVFKGLRQMEKLDLSYNNIKVVDMDILLTCISLKELNLRFNSRLDLHGLEDILYSASSMMETLDIHGLELDSIPTNLFIATPYIRKLILSSNRLTGVPVETLQKLKFLTVLDLSDNYFGELHAVDFDGLGTVEELYLNNINSLQYIGEKAFQTMYNLKVLWCSYNPKLRAIHPGAFSGLQSNTSGRKWNLEEVHFRQNSFNSLAEELLPWDKVRYVDLCENPWVCDCRLAWMKNIKWSLRNAPPVSCEAPRLLRTRLVSDIPRQNFRCESPIDAHMAASIMLLLCTLSLLTVGFCIFACWKLNWFNMCRAKFQKRYFTLKSAVPNDAASAQIIGIEMQAPSDDGK